jgi:hypothetical protein
MEVYEWVQEVLANLELIVDSCVLLSSIEGGKRQCSRFEPRLRETITRENVFLNE